MESSSSRDRVSVPAPLYPPANTIQVSSGLWSLGETDWTTAPVRPSVVNVKSSALTPDTGSEKRTR
jgi:hypothetical protein